MHIEHINISAPMALLSDVKDFYCQLFRLDVGFRPKFSRNGFWLYHDQNSLIHLTESNEHFENKQQGYLDHIAFQLTGLPRFIDELNAMSIKYTSDHLPEIGMTQLFFSDPAGNGLEANFKHEKMH